MAFPQVASLVAASDSAAGTSHVATMPATVEANDLLFVGILTDANTTFTTPSGWTSKSTQNDSVPSSRTSLFCKVADGSEDGTTVDFQTAASSRCEWLVGRITAASWLQNLAGIEVTQAATSVNNPPALTPSWGALDTLWFVLASDDGAIPTSAGTPPTNYGNSVNSNRNYGSVNHYITMARRELNASSEDPGAWSSGGNYNWTIGIQPSAGGGGGTIKARRTSHMLGTRAGSRTF